MIEVRGKNVIITGGANGIGLAISKAFAAAGASVIIADINLAQAEKAAEDLRASGCSSLAAHVDVTDEASVEALMAITAETFGRIDVLINNAGICMIAPLESTDLSVWRRTMDINVTSVFLCSRAVIPYMKKQGGGRIINAASQAGKVGMTMLSHYCASKAAVILLTRSLALELAPYNILVNSVCPGNVSTDMMRREADMVNKLTGQSIEKIIEDWTSGIPLGRYATPEEVAGIYLFLASDYACYMTGEDVNVTGGQTMC